MTLKQLSAKVGYGTGNLSSYETGKLQAKDATLQRILTRGFDMTENKALTCIAQWRKKSLEKTYQGILSLAQSDTPYNENIPKKDVVQYLKDEGHSPQEIEEILKKMSK
jgi:hypothetical protein